MIGHQLRHENLFKKVLEYKEVGRNRRGRPRRTYISQIVEDMECREYTEMYRLAQNRQEWRAATNRP